MFTTRKTLGVFSTALAVATVSSVVRAEAPATPSTYDIQFAPRIETTGTHTDNYLKAPNGTKDSSIALALISNLKLSKQDQIITSDFGLSSTKHFTHADEEDDSYYLSANILQRASKKLSFTAAARVDDTVLARRAITEEDADHLTKTKTYNVSIGSTYEADKQKYTVTLQQAVLDLSDNTKSGNTLNKDDEDRSETDLILHGEYKLNEVFQPSFTVGYGQINYEATLDDHGNDRTSEVTRLLVGGNYKIGSHASVNGDVGYYLRNYRGVSFESIKVLVGNVMLKVQADENLIGFGSYSRSFNELNIADSPGLIVDTYSAGFIYKPTKKFSVKGSTSKTISVAQLVGIEAKDYVNSVGCVYAFNERYNAGLQYSNSRRYTNSQIILPFTDNTIMLKLSAAF